MIEILGHCGFLPSVLLALVWPPLVIGALIPFHSSSLRHEMHHKKLNVNFGLFFTFWDTIYGTDFKDPVITGPDAHRLQVLYEETRGTDSKASTLK